MDKQLILNKIKEYYNFQKDTQFADFLGIPAQNLSKWKTRNTYDAELIYTKCTEISPEWLLTGNGDMLKSDANDGGQKRNLIPLYEDVETIGGTQQTAGLNATFNSSVKIDAGDWFNGATAAIRHYGDSMIEYESGCTLVIRELTDKNEIIWGRNYVVETDEMRITKKIANYDDEYIMCYSTNYDTYPDGTLIHQPIKVRKENIKHLSRVLGCVNKEESTGKVRFV
ncbi:hypothetical protein BWK63_13185 [Flavobacterium covae]|uniref:helix-turn-helix domain-containing protein n=1 Tax=Flavobacterium TaxID=237 RepID=UPI000B4C79F2|nr:MULTISPECIES: helix-turn-helix domain-containing protein [Flavobacterium]OWP80022.1 hypothetical protein BWK63_13185 [Flavobacterium covae]POR20552.1 hypothetical protein BWK57_13145 [Flavobacterium columnare]